MNELEQNIWLPPAASTVASEVDPLYYFILWASTVFFAIVLFAILYFVKKYKKDGVREKLEPQVSHNSKLEIFWTAIPTILIIIVFFWGARSFLKMQIWPVDSMQVQVYANAWHFDFLYSFEDDQFKSDSLVVPMGTPVNLMMTAEESQPIHSFYIPDFRIKKDIMANRYSQTWFESNYPGTYDFYCTEYCGENHSNMNGHVVVMPAEAEKWNDVNKNEKFDNNEVFVDSNNNGTYDQGEKFLDIGNAKWDKGEDFIDCNKNRDICEEDEGWNADMGDGEYSLGEDFTDIGDGLWSKQETYTDANKNGKWDTGYKYWFERKVVEHKESNLLAGAALGEKKYKEHNCHTCHSNGINPGGVGPSFVGLWDKKIKEYGNINAPELETRNYIIESIRYPNRVIVPGYTDQMPKTYTEEKISNEEIGGIIEYIKTLK